MKEGPGLLTEYLKGKRVVIVYYRHIIKKNKKVETEYNVDAGKVTKILTGVDDIYIVIEPEDEYWINEENGEKVYVKEFIIPLRNIDKISILEEVRENGE